jgi:hypothetical protein
MTFYIWVQSDKSHRRRLPMSIKLYDKEEGDAPIKILEDLKVPELLVIL